jgi:sterol desaturase/sphingolipid hydroxylase (fatty acid hydroxylase superfamily)
MKDSRMLPFPDLPPTSLVDWMMLAATLMGGAFLVLLPVELWKNWQRGQLNRRLWLEMVANLSTLVPTVITAGLSGSFILWLYTGASTLALWQIQTTPLSVILALIIVDFIYYWDHRIAHRVGLIWAAMHSVHHSSPIFNQTTANRISFVDGFVSPVYYALPVLAGFDPLLIIAALGVNLAYQQWIHTETIGTLGWFDRWFNSPANHRVHHGSQPHYLDKNYGGISMVWDRLFGTYQPENEPVIFGLTEPIESVNPIAVHGTELARLWRKMRAAPSWRMKLKLLIGPPGVEAT